jgi:deazaflavin-dependent oxidoreductase (nitroreductase family)
MAKDPNDRPRPVGMSWIEAHAAQYRKDPESAHDWDVSALPQSNAEGIYPTLLLTTKGRKSGRPRSVPLLYQPCGEGFIVVGSRGGSAEHPAWYLNLQADPACAVLAGRLECRTRAKTLTGERRTRYWDLMVRCWPDYASYQALTTREIPVVVLAIESVALSGRAGRAG